LAGPFGAGFFLQVTEQSEGHGKEEGSGGGVGDPHRGEGRGAEEADAGEVKASPRKDEDGIGQPAVESLAGEGGRDSEAAHEEEDEVMGESGEGLGNHGGGITLEYPVENGDHRNQKSGDGERNGLGQPEGGGQGEDRETGADLCRSMGIGIIDRQEPVDEGEGGHRHTDEDQFAPGRPTGEGGLFFTNDGLLVLSHWVLLRVLAELGKRDSRNSGD